MGSGNIQGVRIGPFEFKEPLPELRRPYAFAMLRPWVDVGGVGGLVLSHLENRFGARPLGMLARPGNFFDFTRYRPVVYFREGKREVAIPNVFINWAEGEENDFLFFHLLEPHNQGEDFAEGVFQVQESLGVKRYHLVGSMYDMVPHTRPFLISGSAQGGDVSEMLSRLGIQPSSYQGPTTIAILVTQMAIQKGIETLSLIVHLPQYAQLEEDYSGGLRLLEVLDGNYHWGLDLGELRRKAQEQREQLSQALERNLQGKALLEQLERHYETRLHREEEVRESGPLSPEVERFLREINRRFSQD